MTDHYAFLKAFLVDRLHVPDENVHADRTFDEIGLDSIAYVEMALAFEKNLGVALDEDEISPYDTVGDVAALLANRSKAA